MNAVVKQNQDVELTVRCKAFSCEGVRNNRLLVEADGTIRVFDSVAGHYTTAHAISKATESKIRKLALHAWKMSHFYGI